MNSAVLPSFGELYEQLDEAVCKCARISVQYRALQIMDGDTVTWFWIGNDEEYEQYLGR